MLPLAVVLSLVRPIGYLDLIFVPGTPALWGFMAVLSVLGHPRLERGPDRLRLHGALMLPGRGIMTERGRYLKDKFDHTAHAPGAANGDR